MDFCIFSIFLYLRLLYPCSNFATVKAEVMSQYSGDPTGKELIDQEAPGPPDNIKQMRNEKLFK